MRCLCLLPFIVAAGCNGVSPDPEPTAAATATSAAPAPAPRTVEIAVQEVRGDALAAAIAKHKDKVVVVDLWATWCTSCVQKFPHFIDIHKKYADKGLVCISVSMDRLTPTTYKKDNVLKFLTRQKAAFPNYVILEPEDDEKDLAKLLTEDYRLIPLMVIYDKAGRRVWSSGDGPKLSDEQLDKKIEDLLAK